MPRLPGSAGLTAAACIAACAFLIPWMLSAEADAAPNGISFGAYAHPINGETNQEALENLEQELGTTLPLVRAFAKWDDAIGEDKPLHRWARDGGRDLAVSIKPERADGSIVAWKSIADAAPGSALYRDMQRFADSARRFDAPMILIFHHEPERNDNTKFGTSDEFKRAFRKLRTVFDAEGVTNVHFAWVMTDWSFQVGEIRPNDRRVADKWYPGDDAVDMLGVDPYNWNNCRGTTTEPWRSLEVLIAAFMRFADRHPDKPLLLGEWGSDEGAPGQKAAWLKDAHDLLAQEPYQSRFASVMYYHDDGREEGWFDCNWWLDTSPSALQAAQAMVSDTRFRTKIAAPANPKRPLQPEPQPPESSTPPNGKTPGTIAPQVTSPPAVTQHLCDGRPATIVGTSGDDQLVGTSGPDVIDGRGGDDTIIGLQGDDLICGGDGNDEILGGGGADRLFGNAGSDLIRGGYGPDKIFGGAGQDRLNGQHGNDEISGGNGRDVLRGGPHQDSLHGGAHADRLLGQGGFDRLLGGSGHDRLEGGVGADFLRGGIGDDQCIGGSGRDDVRCER